MREGEEMFFLLLSCSTRLEGGEGRRSSSRTLRFKMETRMCLLPASSLFTHISLLLLVDVAAGLELGGDWCLMMQSAHPLREFRESLGQPVFTEACTLEICAIADCRRIFFFMYKICVTDLQEVFIYSSN